MAVTFDAPNRLIILPAAGNYDVQVDLYSDWKEWVGQSDNAKYPPAFDTVGGDSIGAGQEVAPYFFLRTDLGWRIRAPETDGDVVIQGNLFPRNPGDSLFLPPVGEFTVLITQQLSSQAVVVETGVSGLTSAESDILQALREANFNRRVWDKNGNTIIIYADDGVTPKHVFDVNQDLSEITPQ